MFKILEIKMFRMGTTAIMPTTHRIVMGLVSRIKIEIIKVVVMVVGTLTIGSVTSAICWGHILAHCPSHNPIIPNQKFKLSIGGAKSATPPGNNPQPPVGPQGY